MLSAACRRLTFSNVVALIALFIALGGTAYAVKKVNGKSLVASSVTGKKLKKNTLTGREVNEAKLGAVPKAGDAATLGGKAAADFLASGALIHTAVIKLQPGEERVIATSGPFTVRAICKDAGGGNTKAELTLRSSEAGSINFANEFPPETDQTLVAFTSSGKGTAQAALLQFAAPSGAQLSIISAVVRIGLLGSPCAFTLNGVA